MILLLPFLPLAILLVVTPGPDMALVTRNGLKEGSKYALKTSFGIVCGLLVWTGASAVGVAIILEANAFAFTAVKLAGAGYLTFLGVRALISMRRKKDSSEMRLPKNVVSVSGRVNSPFLQGFINDILNPKIAVLFTSLIVQFVTPGSPMISLESAELGAIFTVITLGWLSVFSILVSSAGSLFRVPRVKRMLDALTGIALVGLGIGVAVDTK